MRRIMGLGLGAILASSHLFASPEVYSSYGRSTKQLPPFKPDEEPTGWTESPRMSKRRRRRLRGKGK